MYYTITEVSIRFPFSSSGLALFREDSILAQRPSEKNNYDFIVMAAKGKPGDRHLLGSVTRKVLAKAKIPVYVV